AAQQTGDGGASLVGGGGRPGREGVQRESGGRVDRGPLVASEGLDDRSGGIPEKLEAAHAGDGSGEIAGLHFAFALLEQVDNRGDGGGEGSIASGRRGGLGGVTHGAGTFLGGLTNGFARL
ncbi:MAG: hypothetical protein ACK56I_05800, partial [bacterium]